MVKSFTFEVKNEILGSIGKGELRSFMSALIHTAGTLVISDSGLTLRLRLEEEAVRSFTKQALDELCASDCAIIQKNSVLVSGQAADDLLKDLHILKDDYHLYAGVQKSLISSDAARTAYAKGAFVGCGSVNVGKSYHLELSLSNMIIAQDLVKLFMHFNITGKILQRGKRFILYIKNSQNISDMLVLLGAHKAMLELNLTLVDKQIAQLANRRSNCDLANIDKTVSAFIKQRQAITALKECGEFDKLSTKLKDAGQARIDNPDISLEALAKMLGLTKSGLTHRLRRLMEIYNQLLNK